MLLYVDRVYEAQMRLKLLATLAEAQPNPMVDRVEGAQMRLKPH